MVHVPEKDSVSVSVSVVIVCVLGSLYYDLCLCYHEVLYSVNAVLYQ